MGNETGRKPRFCVSDGREPAGFATMPPLSPLLSMSHKFLSAAIAATLLLTSTPAFATSARVAATRKARAAQLQEAVMAARPTFRKVGQKKPTTVGNYRTSAAVRSAQQQATRSVVASGECKDADGFIDAACVRTRTATLTEKLMEEWRTGVKRAVSSSSASSASSAQ